VGDDDRRRELFEAYGRVRELEAETARLRAEAEVERERHRQVEADLTRDLRRAHGDIDQFAHVSAHDLQEPLRNVITLVQLLQRSAGDGLDARSTEMLDLIVGASQRMHGQVNDLLAYSRVAHSGRERQSTDLGVAVQRARTNLEVVLEGADARLDCGPLPTVHADPNQMVQLFQNLIGNAIKFRGEESLRIAISGAARDDHWHVAVRDNGIGIEPAGHQRIFRIFRRLHPPGEFEGSGVGLAICKRIVDRHGGRIWVESAPGEGSAFHFTLPLDVDLGDTA